jgi:3-methyl-2-oxobutanoate hydroxymethyltransferase
MITAYDTPGAGMASDAGVDMILVGDSLAMAVLGHHDTLAIGVDEMVHHVAAVARARPIPLVVADLPWLSFHLNRGETVTNAARLIRAGARAVKLEGGRKRLPMIEALLDAEIPVMGHIGLTPQSVHALGGFKVQGRTEDAAKELLEDARALDDAGVFAIVIEGVPASLAIALSEAVAVPTIGIGAGPGCDGQVLVFHDVLGLQDQLRPRFVRRYASLREVAVDALSRFAADVRSGDFPSAAESYGAPSDRQR